MGSTGISTDIQKVLESQKLFRHDRTFMVTDGVGAVVNGGGDGATAAVVVAAAAVVIAVVDYSKTKPTPLCCLPFESYSPAENSHMKYSIKLYVTS